MSSSNFGPERRSYLRVSLAVGFRDGVTQYPESHIRLEGDIIAIQLLDISEGGLAFSASVEIPENLELEIAFDLVGELDSAKVKVRGQVRYCLLRADYKTYRIGIEFSQVEEQDRGLIAQAINLLKNKNGFLDCD